MTTSRRELEIGMLPPKDVVSTYFIIILSTVLSSLSLFNFFHVIVKLLTCIKLIEAVLLNIFVFMSDAQQIFCLMEDYRYGIS